LDTMQLPIATHIDGSVPFAHVAIDHSHSQQSVPRGFLLFKHCEWLVVNCNVGKRASLHSNRCLEIFQEMFKRCEWLVSN